MLALFPRMSCVREGRRDEGGKGRSYQEKDPAFVGFEASVEGIGNLWVSGPLFVHLVDQRVEVVAKDVPMENPFRHQVKGFGRPQGNALQDDETLGGGQNPNNLFIRGVSHRKMRSAQGRTCRLNHCIATMASSHLYRLRARN